MSAKTMRAVAAAILATALLVSAGCVRVELPKAAYTTTSQSVALEGATEVHAVIEMGAGTLSVKPGATGLMDASFGYTDDTWEPIVSYELRDGKGDLAVRTPDKPNFNFAQDMRYEWDIALGADVPLDLAVSMGAGESTLDLAGLDLRRLQVILGAGESTIDLSGAWSNDLDASIQAGVGSLRIRVPESVGVRITGADDGIGDYQADGFKQEGNALVNDAYETADVTLEITLTRGIGEVTVETVR